MLTASQCATYDEVKGRVQAAAGWGDHLGTHLACAMATGLVSTTATNPVDVVKTHMFTGGWVYVGLGWGAGQGRRGQEQRRRGGWVVSHVGSVVRLYRHCFFMR